MAPANRLSCLVFASTILFADSLVSCCRQESFSHRSPPVPSKVNVDLVTLGINSRRASLQAIPSSDLMDTGPFSAPLLLSAALVVGISAQFFINQMIKGDQGLGAFLKDGSGYNKSALTNSQRKAEAEDPLPWLKLPKLDFVEVAGQAGASTDNEALLVEQLEAMRFDLKKALDEGRVQEAESIREELEKTMKDNGIEFKPF